MALAQGAAPTPPPPPQQQERKRVKVYELKNNDWFDRGTGFCSGTLIGPPASFNENPDARIVVVSEDDMNRVLLETRITKDDGYQKQQDTLIVWTESNGVDMALSFQEAEGCASIWEFVSEVQTRLAALAPDDGLSDDLLDPPHPIVLPEPQLGALEDIDHAIRAASTTPAGRDALSKFIMSAEVMYILKLGPLVEMAEELQATDDLHHLCAIVKHLILLNDTSIIEFVVTDQAIMGVVGALEYDPDFPSHRANHRQYLSDSSKFKEVVEIKDDEIRKKIHYTYRLLYLKDVVLARILDDPTFSVLNSLIFFHQVDIVNHLQSNQAFLKELFEIFSKSTGPDGSPQPPEKKKEAVLFIQNCCAVSKNIQAQSRAQLYHNFIQHGLFTVVTFALRHHDASVRVAGTDVLVALIDHDPHMVRNHIFTALKEQAVPLTDTLIELLLVEVDLGVKSQMADAIKILLDPSSSGGPLDAMARQAAQQNAEIMARRGGAGMQGGHPAPQTDAFIATFYDESAKRLFQPLKQLEGRTSMRDLSVHETSLMTHLVEVLCFFVRQHSYRSKLFILSENLHARIAQLLACPQKHVKLTALKWFRVCIGLGDEFHNRYLVQHRIFESILNIVFETMPRDNLLNSACLELFEYIKKEGIKQLIAHLVEQYHDRLLSITYVPTFHHLIDRYEEMQAGYEPGNSVSNAGEESVSTQDGAPRPTTINGNARFAGLKEMDGDEEAYFNGDDDDDIDDPEEGDEAGALPAMIRMGGLRRTQPNGEASPARPLVDYPLDDDEEEDEEESTALRDHDMDLLASSPDQPPKDNKKSSSSSSAHSAHSSSDPLSGGADSMTTEGDTEHIELVQQQQHSTRGRSRAPVPVDGSPGNRNQPPSPPEPLASKRRREADEDDDELDKMMMGGTKRRNSSASSLASQTGRLGVLDESSTTNIDGADGVVNHDQQLQKVAEETRTQQSTPTHGHALRRKGSLRTKNETPNKHHLNHHAGAGGKLAVKPIHNHHHAGGGAREKEKKDGMTTRNGAVQEAQDGGGDGAEDGSG